MAQHESIDGIVIRARDMGDHDRYLTVLTAERGRITILAKGGRSLKGPQVAVSQLYTYSNLEYYRRGDFNVLKGGSTIENFYGLASDMDRLNLAAYLCELAAELTDEGEEAGEMLRLLLNSLHAVSRGLYPIEQVKGAFEMRAAAVSGYEPDLSGCSRCGRTTAEPFYLDVMNGALECPECLAKAGKQARTGDYADEIREAEIIARLPMAAVAAMRYCLHAPLNRLFAFELTDPEDLARFAKHAETYLLSHIGHGFESLRFYHEMREGTPPAKKGTRHEFFRKDPDNAGIR